MDQQSSFTLQNSMAHGHETFNTYTAGNIGVHTQHHGYWWPGAFSTSYSVDWIFIALAQFHAEILEL